MTAALVNSKTVLRNSLVTTNDVQQGDLWWATFPKPDGKTRPCLVVSGDRFNTEPSHGDVLVVPLTSRIRRERLENQVVIPSKETGLHGDSLTKVNRLQSIDRRRLVEWVTCLRENTVQDVLSCIKTLLGLADK